MISISKTLLYISQQTDVCNYADDTTFHACDTELSDLIRRLEHDSKIAIEWFECNYMKLNRDKCHLVAARHKYEHLWINVGGSKIWESESEEI